jgi:hypothetical protein
LSCSMLPAGILQGLVYSISSHLLKIFYTKTWLGPSCKGSSSENMGGAEQARTDSTVNHEKETSVAVIDSGRCMPAELSTVVHGHVQRHTAGSAADSFEIQST